MQGMEKIYAQTAAPKVPEWPSYGKFTQGHPKTLFSKKVQSGDQEKFFKNRPRSTLVWKVQSTLKQKALSCN